jgi:hypothetical protein
MPDLNTAIVRGVLRREPSLDFLTAQAASLRGMNNLAVLALASRRQRVLISHDQHDTGSLRRVQGSRKT